MSTNPALGVIVAGAIGSFGGIAGARVTRKIGPIIANITEEERHQDDLEITDHPVEQGATISDHAFKRPAEVTIKVSWSNSPNKSSTISGDLTNAVIDRLSGTVQTAVTNAAQKAIGGSAVGNLAVGKLSELTGLNLAAIAQANTGTGKGTTTIQDIYQQLLALQEGRQLIDIYTGKRVYKNMLIKSMSTESSMKTENALPVTLICRQIIIVQTAVVTVTAAAANQAFPELTNPVANFGTKQLFAAPLPYNSPGAPWLTVN